MIVPHHGSKTSSTLGFMQAASPSISIFTNGYLNRHKHPNPQVLERYQATGGHLYRSDYNGAIEMRFIRHSEVSKSEINQSTDNQGEIYLLSWRDQYKRYWQDVFLPP